MLTRAAGSTDTTDADALVTSNLHLVDHVVRSLAARFPRHVDRDELWNAGAYGLVDASRRFDPDQGVPFARYALLRIRGSIIDATRTRDWASRSTRRTMREVRDAGEAFAQQHGRQPTSHELAALLDVDVATLESHRAAATTASVLHLDQPVSGVDEPDITLADLVVETHDDVLPLASLERGELMGTLKVAVERLPELLREVLVRHYLQGEQLTDIAAELDVTVARVSQIRLEAVNAVRAYLASVDVAVPQVPEDAPGQRARQRYVASMAETSWHERVGAAPRTRVLATV